MWGTSELLTVDSQGNKCQVAEFSGETDLSSVGVAGISRKGTNTCAGNPLSV